MYSLHEGKLGIPKISLRRRSTVDLHVPVDSTGTDASERQMMMLFTLFSMAKVDRRLDTSPDASQSLPNSRETSWGVLSFSQVHRTNDLEIHGGSSPDVIAIGMIFSLPCRPGR